MNCLVFGETIWDVYPTERTIGGAPFNFAANLAHLGDTAYLLSAVGDDELGREAFMSMEHHGIRQDLMQVNAHETGKCLVTLDDNRIPQYNVLTDVAYDHITADENTVSRIQALAPDALYFGTLCQRGASEKALDTLLSQCTFREIFCDINIRDGCSDAATTEKCLSRATVLKISDEEAHFIADYGLVADGDGSLEERLAKQYKNLKQVILTMGKNGSRVYDCATGQTVESGRPDRVNVVSTVGAGDCYGATYFHWYMAGASVRAAIDQATKRSNIVVASYSALPF